MLGDFWNAPVNANFQSATCSKQLYRVRSSRVCAPFAGQNGSFTKNGLFPLKACQNRLARRLLAMTRRTWDSEPKTSDKHHEQKKVKRTLGTVPISMELKIRRVGWAKRMADSSCQQVLAAIFGHACTDKYPSLTSEEELTAHATPWGKAVSR